MQRAASAPNFSAFTVAMPEIRPSAGVLRMRSSTARRRRWAAMASEPYSTNEPSSTSCAMFSRAVRWLVLRRRSNGLRTCRPRVANRGFRRGGAIIGRDAGFDQRRLGGRLGFADEISDMGLDEAGADAVLDKIRMRQNRRQEGDVGRDATDPE